MPGSEKIGAIIKRARITEGLTQAQLANLLGVTQPTIAAVEAGTQGLGLDLLDALEQILGISVTYVSSD
jgi:transcriptional regulator with XRE-family HTH domain